MDVPGGGIGKAEQHRGECAKVAVQGPAYRTNRPAVRTTGAGGTHRSEADRAYERHARILVEHRNRECAFLSSLEPLPYSNWKLFSYTIHKTGKLKQLSEEIVSADDPRLREAYPFQQFMYLEDIGAALGAGGWDTHAIYDRLYSPLQRHPGQTDECT
jgi:hypothetical protein